MRRTFRSLVHRKMSSLGLLGAAALAAIVVAVPAQAAPFVYVTNAGEFQQAVSQYDAAGGPLAPLSPPTINTGHGSPSGLAVSPDGKNAYVTATYCGTPGHPADCVSALLRYSVGADGSLTPRSSAAMPPGTPLLRKLVISPDGRSLYAIGLFSGGNSLTQYTVAANGALTLKSPATVPTAREPDDLAVSPNGRSVYVTGSSGAIWQYTAHGDGTLSLKSPPRVPTHAWASGVAVSPDSRSVYVVNFNAIAGRPGLVSQYTAHADGSLSPKSPPTVHAGPNPSELAISPNGRAVYVTDSNFTATLTPGRVSQYRVAAGGMLIPQSPATVAARIYPGGIAVHPDGRSVYVANAGSKSLSQYTIGADGRLSAKSPAAVAAGDSPFEIAIGPAIGPGPASVSVVGTALSVKAAPGAQDNLAITRPSPSTVRVTDFPSGAYTGSVVKAGDGCTQSGAYAANCPTSGITPSLPAQVTSGDRGDKVTNSSGLPTALYGESGDDVLIGGPARDILNGGAGADLFSGMDGNDLLRGHEGASDQAIDCGGGSDKADLDLLPLDANVKGCEAKTRH